MHRDNSNGSRASFARGFMTLCAMLLAYSVLGVAATVPSTPVHAQSFSGLGFLPGGDSSIPQGVNADGTVVVGFGNATGSNQEAFRWTRAGGMVGLGFLPGGAFSTARGVNADGTVVVGSGGSGQSSEAFRWTQAGGMVGLGFLNRGNFSDAFGVNADGTVVVGGSGEAFRWTQAGGMAGLGFLPGGTFSEAFGVNADGTVVVGDAQDEASFSFVAIRWTQTDGIQSVQELLTAKGVDTTGWTLRSAQGVSADGQVIVGVGRDPNGRTQGWIANLGPITVPFLAFNAKLEIDLERRPNKDSFELESSFTLSSAASNGIHPDVEPVTLQVGTFAVTIPPGSFKKHENEDDDEHEHEREDGLFTFHGVIDGVRLKALIKRTGTLRYAFHAGRRGTPT